MEKHLLLNKENKKVNCLDSPGGMKTKPELNKELKKKMAKKPRKYCFDRCIKNKKKKLG